MLIAIALYQGLTLLDAFGPYAMLAHGPDATVRFVAETSDPIIADVGTPRLLADLTFAECPAPDVVVVPGGPGVARDGKVVTAAGVSAGIDMALTLAGKLWGDTVAMAIQLGNEYDPQPPYDAGSPAKAPAAVLELLRGGSPASA